LAATLSFSPDFASHPARGGELGFIDQYDGRTLTGAVAAADVASRSAFGFVVNGGGKG